ncbi:hypothetical protein FPANT_12817 [Fusarium pseudoanthophilum]|uniref:Uncharacterized protein n=1 Tax=Fusarium pseudoanthophilum TaxID=48495 RepID=A0A8H5KHY0_9HYPO|nr:hypothetical protein FPANT_12817 [Fusarium pseudoanthophilum]
MTPLYGDPTTEVHPKHTIWMCLKQANGPGSECNTHNDINDLMCRKCDYEVDGWIKVEAMDKDEKVIGELHDMVDGVVRWKYFWYFLHPGSTMEDAPGNNAPVPRGTIPG